MFKFLAILSIFVFESHGILIRLVTLYFEGLDSTYNVLKHSITTAKGYI
jgi:hypothetical protein